MPADKELMNTTQDWVEDNSTSLIEVLAPLRAHWISIIGLAVGAAVLTYGGSFLIAPTFTARTSFISPQQQQNSAASALASLGAGALSSLASNAAGIKSPADQYVALMQSVTLSDKILDQFKLQDLYRSEFRMDARRKLASNVRITAGKKDSLITVEVDDESPQRAADIANAYVRELKSLTDTFALTEAQQRRVFFDKQLRNTRTSLGDAQRALQQSGINAGALKGEPKAAVETYARIKAEISATQVRLGTLQNRLTNNTPEVQQLQATLAGLRSQLAEQELPLPQAGTQDYVGALREYKYQEALFEIYARQFELAKMDEGREGTVIQVLDTATPPERKSKPQRLVLMAMAFAVTAISASAFFIFRSMRYRNKLRARE